MANSINPEAEPNELYIRTNEVFGSSHHISSIQNENDRTPVADDRYSSYYYHHHNREPQFDMIPLGVDIPLFLEPDTQPFPQPSDTQPFPQPADILAQARTPAQASTDPSVVQASIASGSQHPPTPRAALAPIAVPPQIISHNYQGNRFALRNQSANIAPELSTSVWITNLPPNCNYAQLLGMMRHTGKIYATVINPPQGHFMTSAAKIVFFDIGGRQRFEARANTGQFVVGSYVPRVRPNRILTAAQPSGVESRVLHITGPERIVNEKVLCDYFRRWCAFDLEYVKSFPTGGGRVTMAWAFGSYRCQAERVFTTIRDNKLVNMRLGRTDIWDSVDVMYGIDPCY
ncbi:hypothetical protein F4859DRAFT_514984 [Xylaria cf. heliscus]|nr:hypothetical protein F4859DRAFT_514984 [Xylaria cf. heliscus]